MNFQFTFACSEDGKIQIYHDGKSVYSTSDYYFSDALSTLIRKIKSQKFPVCANCKHLFGWHLNDGKGPCEFHQGCVDVGCDCPIYFGT